jgi:ATP-dependent protease Clp ATPase subunit
MKCSFCKQEDNKVQRLIFTKGLFVCDDCVLKFIKLLSEQNLPLFQKMQETINDYQGNPGIAITLYYQWMESNQFNNSDNEKWIKTKSLSNLLSLALNSYAEGNSNYAKSKISEAISML